MELSLLHTSCYLPSALIRTTLCILLVIKPFQDEGWVFTHAFMVEFWRFYCTVYIACLRHPYGILTQRVYRLYDVHNCFNCECV